MTAVPGTVPARRLAPQRRSPTPRSPARSSGATRATTSGRKRTSPSRTASWVRWRRGSSRRTPAATSPESTRCSGRCRTTGEPRNPRAPAGQPRQGRRARPGARLRGQRVQPARRRLRPGRRRPLRHRGVRGAGTRTRGSRRHHSPLHRLRHSPGSLSDGGRPGIFSCVSRGSGARERAVVSDSENYVPARIGRSVAPLTAIAGAERPAPPSPGLGHAGGHRGPGRPGCAGRGCGHHVARHDDGQLGRGFAPRPDHRGEFG